MLNALKKFFSTNIVSMCLFGLVGLLTAGVYFIVFACFYDVFHVNYKIAVTVSYVCSVAVHFMVNRTVTFKDRPGAFGTHLIKYSIVLLINYLITLSVVSYVVGNLSLSPYIGIIFAIGLTVSSGYFLIKFWVFRVKSSVKVRNAY